MSGCGVREEWQAFLALKLGSHPSIVRLAGDPEACSRTPRKVVPHGAVGELPSYGDFFGSGPDVREWRSSSVILPVHGESKQAESRVAYGAPFQPSGWTMPSILGGLAKPLAWMYELFGGDSGMGSGWIRP
ncbi:hypothetical protein ACLOJK_023159 [Asimina triloba]